MNRNQDVIRQFLLVSLVEIICVALMIGVYALFDKFSREVLIGGLLGGGLAIANFLLLSMAVSRAADQATESGDSSKVALAIRSSSMTRLLGIAAVLFLAFRAGFCDPIAALLPLIFLRLSMMITGFFFKDGAICR